MRSHVKASLDLPRVVNLAHVDDLAAARPGNLFRVALAHQRLVRGLDRVHLVSRAADAPGKIVDTGGTAHFVNQVLDAETEAWNNN